MFSNLIQRLLSCTIVLPEFSGHDKIMFFGYERFPKTKLIWYISKIKDCTTHTHIYIYIYTLTGHFIRYTLLVPGWTPFCLQNCLNSSWHRFNKMLETFLRDFGPYWHDSIMQLLYICWLHIHDANLPFHHIPKVLYWIEIWWLWRTVEAIWVKWTHCHVQETSLRWFELYESGRLWRLNDAQLVQRGPKCAKKISPTSLHQHHQPEPLRQGRMDPCFHVL